MSDSPIRFVFDDSSAKAGRAAAPAASASRAQGEATGSTTGISDNFLLQNFLSLATVQLVTNTDNFSNRVIQLLRRDCTDENTVCPTNVLLDNFIFSKNKNCETATKCAGCCIPYLTDGVLDKSWSFQIPAVGLANVRGFTQVYDREPSVAQGTLDWNKPIGVPPSQVAFLYIQAQQSVTTDVGGVPTQSLRKVAVIPTCLKICFPDCGSTCGSGFTYVDDESVSGGAYFGYATPLTGLSGAAVFPYNNPVTAVPSAAVDFRFLHCINASVAEKLQNYNSGANQLPHAHLRFEWQAFATNQTWRTVVVQYQCTTTEGCVIFPCLTNYLDGYTYLPGDALDAASEFRLAVSRYAVATDATHAITTSSTIAAATASTIAWKDMPCVAFTLNEIEMIGAVQADPNFNDSTTTDCASGTYVWTAIPPHEIGASFTTAANNTDPDAVGRLTLKQLDGSSGQILEVSNYSTLTHTYRVHVISPDTPFATA